jgi:hypothetical protein
MKLITNRYHLNQNVLTSIKRYFFSFKQKIIINDVSNGLNLLYWYIINKQIKCFIRTLLSISKRFDLF